METLQTAKKSLDHKTEVSIGENIVCGGKQLLIIAGPCAVESEEQIDACGAALSKVPVQALRGGVFKPRTSPYAFQGLGEAGVSILKNAGNRYGMPVVAEVMSAEQLKIAVDSFDVLQIGSRNMQNFELLKAVSHTRKPVLLKRGLAATVDEFLMAAEYIMAGGNTQVILCERGIRSFDSHTRNVLDLGAVVSLKQLTHLPVIVDPSHAAGRSELVADLARAAVACGADGVMIECHPQPLKSVSDARQALSLDEMSELIYSLSLVASAVGRTVQTSRTGPWAGGQLTEKIIVS
ncbi:MAG: 3-deoxy-7-phosphoheptulonate synthase [Leptolyngbya sp.]|nr:3-deoxy-7-phosphoheptulonate synthase [Candidatus Melainabacteria bacterium]